MPAAPTCRLELPAVMILVGSRLKYLTHSTFCLWAGLPQMGCPLARSHST